MKLTELIKNAQLLLERLGDLDVFFPGDYGLEPVKNIVTLMADSEDDDEEEELIAVIQVESGDNE